MGLKKKLNLDVKKYLLQGHILSTLGAGSGVILVLSMGTYTINWMNKKSTNAGFTPAFLLSFLRLVKSAANLCTC
jgi:NhaP-type Na+/H+ and K+/H+ antiporter